jgi:hypothetical protein
VRCGSWSWGGRNMLHGPPPTRSGGGPAAPGEDESMEGKGRDLVGLGRDKLQLAYVGQFVCYFALLLLILHRIPKVRWIISHNPLWVSRLLDRVTLIPRFMNRLLLASTHSNLGSQQPAASSQQFNAGPARVSEVAPLGYVVCVCVCVCVSHCLCVQAGQLFRQSRADLSRPGTWAKV